MLGLPSENDRVALTSDGSWSFLQVLNWRDFAFLSRCAVCAALLRRAHHSKYLHHVVAQQFALGFLAHRSKSRRSLSAEIHQGLDAPACAVVSVSACLAKNRSMKQIVLEHGRAGSASAACLNARSSMRVCTASLVSLLRKAESAPRDQTRGAPSVP